MNPKISDSTMEELIQLAVAVFFFFYSFFAEPVNFHHHDWFQKPVHLVFAASQ